LWFQLYVLELQGTIWTKAIFLVWEGKYGHQFVNILGFRVWASE
jgi:hypothetical protein